MIVCFGVSWSVSVRHCLAWFRFVRICVELLWLGLSQSIFFGVIRIAVVSPCLSQWVTVLLCLSFCRIIGWSVVVSLALSISLSLSLEIYTSISICRLYLCRTVLLEIDLDLMLIFLIRYPELLYVYHMSSCMLCNWHGFVLSCGCFI